MPHILKIDTVGLRIKSIKEQYKVLKLAIDLYEHCYWEVSLYELIKLLNPKFGWGRILICLLGEWCGTDEGLAGRSQKPWTFPSCLWSSFQVLWGVWSSSLSMTRMTYSCKGRFISEIFNWISDCLIESRREDVLEEGTMLRSRFCHSSSSCPHIQVNSISII